MSIRRNIAFLQGAERAAVRVPPTPFCGAMLFATCSYPYRRTSINGCTWYEQMYMVRTIATIVICHSLAAVVCDTTSTSRLHSLRDNYSRESSEVHL